MYSLQCRSITSIQVVKLILNLCFLIFNHFEIARFYLTFNFSSPHENAANHSHFPCYRAGLKISVPPAISVRETFRGQSRDQRQPYHDPRCAFWVQDFVNNAATKRTCTFYLYGLKTVKCSSTWRSRALRL